MKIKFNTCNIARSNANTAIEV